MTATVTPIPDDIFTALGNFIMGVLGLPANLVTRGIDNEVSMPPASPGFVNMTALFQIPLTTNVDTWDRTNPSPTGLSAESDTRIDIQLDCYGATSGAWSTMLSTLLRDDYGCAALAPNCQPLYAEDARMLPLEDGEQQYEERWAVVAAIQYNPVTTFPTAFANALNVGLIDVDVRYPPIPLDWTADSNIVTADSTMSVDGGFTQPLVPPWTADSTRITADSTASM